MVSSTQKEWLYRLTIAILLGCFALWATSHFGDFVRDDDEGMNLMKARMVREGYVPHRDIWSDQPPLLTLCLALVFELFGESVLVARCLIVTFACLGLTSTAWIARLLGGRMSSLAAVTFLVFSPQFLDLSRSVMIGLPAHAVAALAMACGLMAVQTRREVWLVAAGVISSASLLIKPVQPFLLVPLGVIIWLWGKSTAGTAWGRWGRKLLLLTTAVIVPLLVVLSLFEGPLLIRQVAGTYFQHQQSRSFRFDRVLSGAAEYVLGRGLFHWTGVVLALYGLVLAWCRRGKKGITVSVWLLVSLVAAWSLTRFRPRYLLLFSFPLAGLLSMGLHNLTCRARLAWAGSRRRWVPLTVGAVAILSLALGTIVEVRSTLAETCCREHPAEEQAVSMLRAICTPRGYVISDDGMLTFRAGLLTPPELTVISFRRMRTGQLTTETLMAASRTYSPEAIVFWDKRFVGLPTGFVGSPEYVDWVNQRYCLVKAWGSSQRIYKACQIPPRADGSLMRLDDLFSVAGWDLDILGASNRVVAPGDRVLLSIRWQVLQSTDTDYHVFCHLGTDTLVAQWDGRPRQGEGPTYRWLQGEEVIDSYVLEVPADVLPGYYPLWVGMYDWATKDRLPVTDPQGRVLARRRC